MALGRIAAAVWIVFASAACRQLGLVKQYEYDERVELSLDGSAIVDINASIPAFVALRGIALDVHPEARFDRQAFRRLFETPGVTVREVTAFRRQGRRFVHVRLDAKDLSLLPSLAPLSWSRYRLDQVADEFRFIQEIGRSAGTSVGDVGWNGSELVAFRVHLPSRINFHNSPLGIERGNILVWEQPLRERLAGAPLRMEARIETESILYHTLWLFGGTFAAAMAMLALVVWWVSRKGRKVVPA